MDTPIETCESRYANGLCSKARQVEIKDSIGVDDLHEISEFAEINLDTLSHSAEDNANIIIDYLAERGFEAAF